MNIQEVMTRLRGKYECKAHPSDKSSIVIYGISLDEFKRLSKELGCSGHYVEETRVAVATNFGQYK